MSSRCVIAILLIGHEEIMCRSFLRQMHKLADEPLPLITPLAVRTSDANRYRKHANVGVTGEPFMVRY